jgi:hypothetical protein
MHSPDIDLNLVSEFKFLHNSPLKPKTSPAHAIKDTCKIFLTLITTPITALTKDFFLKTISQSPNSKFHNQIHVSDTLLSDTQGRTSNLCIKLGSKSILVYQPGTLMFETGVRALSDLSQYNSTGTQLLNGPVLTLAGAIFLAGFLDDLSYAYLETCMATNSRSLINGQTSEDFDYKIYRLTLLAVMKKYVIQAGEVKEFGLLGELQTL